MGFSKNQNKNGSLVLVLDILFVAIGIILLILNLLKNRNILSEIFGR
jgi:hypothetical protein